jgi:hypothetical protein
MIKCKKKQLAEPFAIDLALTNMQIRQSGPQHFFSILGSPK